MMRNTRLYKFGCNCAKKMVVINLGPIECIPFQREVNLLANPDKYAEFPNQLAQSFNSKLRTNIMSLRIL
ncbi:putative SGNH hydrolase-type esterase domain-containing protein [Rosa chinensis]|uniref:Putative SGNH hydrolase-type esterase domain-containing protein n=1 Tax=Rosa chinensis TaxID=74649 RepID=A0A2P6QE34_ROSCH|nr:putative SGNH hydrolase-type esterase domain-containing protein [Rosa chinensis]